MFGPPIPSEAVFKKSKDFSDFLLAKSKDFDLFIHLTFKIFFIKKPFFIYLFILVINAENAAHRSEKFATMATRTRQAYLKDLTLNHSTNTTIEPVQKFCKFILYFYSTEKILFIKFFIFSHAVIQ